MDNRAGARCRYLIYTTCLLRTVSRGRHAAFLVGNQITIPKAAGQVLVLEATFFFLQALESSEQGKPPRKRLIKSRAGV